MAPSYPLDRIRADFPLLSEVTYLNSGTVGLMPEPVLRRHLEAISAYERGGHWSQHDAQAGFELARQSLARLIGASDDELALTGNATDGVNLIAAGLELRPHDVVLTSREEHPAVLVPWAAARRRGGAAIRLFEIPADPDQTLDNVLSAIDAHTRLVVLSHVSCETGKRLPVAEVCRVCRERGIMTLVDGAQSVGQFPVDVRAIGCDFMTGNAHKWLMGPKGTGFLYVRRDMVERLRPVHVGDGSITPSFDRDAFNDDPAGAPWEFAPSARRFEFGTRNWHAYAAIRDVLAYLDGIGAPAIERHCAETSTGLKQRLRAVEGVTLHSPPEWERGSGLVTFSVVGWEGDELSERLWREYLIAQRRVQRPSAVRVSCALFTAPRDVDRLIDAVRALRRPAR